jgi:hypothetical protein
MKKSPRQIRRETQKNKQTQNRLLIYAGLGVAMIAVIWGVIFFANKSPGNTGLVGEEVAVPSRDHVASNTVPGPYNSNPPAGGSHFDTDFPAKFFQESEVAALPKHPEGYLVHSLEHGYVIFWYNCLFPNTDCAALKQSIQKVMDETGGAKLIAFPWAGMEQPLAMTSWGRILKFTVPDPVLMKQFVERNRYQAPEPDAP